MTTMLDGSIGGSLAAIGAVATRLVGSDGSTASAVASRWAAPEASRSSS